MALPLPAQLHINGREIDIQKRIQNIIRRNQNVKERFDHFINMVRHQFFTRLHHIDLCHHP
jgi:hypothetical protein